MTLEPFDWWWSGKFWYCAVVFRNRKFSGAGPTKPQAANDAVKAVTQWQRKRTAARGEGA